MDTLAPAERADRFAKLVNTTRAIERVRAEIEKKGGSRERALRLQTLQRDRLELQNALRPTLVP